MKIIISNLLRYLGILIYTDKLRFYIHFLRTLGEKQKFQKKYPNIKLPPAYLIYESYKLDYAKYFYDGRETAIWLLNYLNKHIELRNISILDWGCGPARIIRHLPELLDTSCFIYGTDYNAKSVSWNRENLPGINFNLNTASPPLPYVDNSFDVVYGISVFTHLTEELHYAWFKELVRISKNNGLIFLTLSGEVFKSKLSPSEIELFNNGQIIAKGNTKIGHRTYTTYHPTAFALKLFKSHEIVEHVPGEIKNGRPQQDVWIIKVNK